MSISTGLLRFILLLPRMSTTGDFLLKDLPGSGKRVDILCRNLEACFGWGPLSWSKDALEFIAIIGDEVTLSFSYPDQNLPKSENEWAIVIRDSLKGNPPEYVQADIMDLNGLIDLLQKESSSHLWVLDENGTPMEKEVRLDSSAPNSFMLGDHRGYDSKAERVFESYCLRRLSLGKTSYLSSHCVAAVISNLERMVQGCL